MRYSAAEKMELIRIVEGSDRSVKDTLDTLQVPRSSFYAWYRSYREGGFDGLMPRKPLPGRIWNRIPEEVRSHVLDVAQYNLRGKDPQQRSKLHLSNQPDVSRKI